ncbi:hypothetical protein BX070DRAFT_223833 [Coemansia spiralis]|nr:hypothetical protein BX070DRAFT_223833 [Coemansia spiralis]
MFGAVWTAVLAALSSPMQTSSDPHVVAACLTGFQSGIAVSSRFRMSFERTTFVTTLRNFTQLQNLAEMRRKHVEAIRALVEVAASRADVGDGLAENWLDVLQCVSQLERLQLLTQGSETSRASSSEGSVFGFGMLSVSSGSNGHSIPARTFFGSLAPAHSGSAQHPTVSVAELAKLETNSQALVVTVDRLFTASVHLSGQGIVDFVRALSQVAWGEITAAFRADDTPRRHGRRSSSSLAVQTTAPSRLFSLTKIVEISYYNMERIRVEWSQIWAILGPLFDRVGAHTDTRAALFALDSLRQLSMKFLEKEELPHFAFQKEFLRPFADILEGYIPETGLGDARAHVVVDPLVKDMVLRCVHQLVQAAAPHIRSGWKAILNVAQIAARDAHDSIAEMGFQIAKDCAEHHGPQIWMLATVSVPLAAPANGVADGDAIAESGEKTIDVVSVSGLEYFHELLDCLSEFAVGAAARRPRFALGAIDTLYLAAVTLGRQVLAHPSHMDSTVIPLDDQPLYRVWMPSLRALHEVVMHTEDLEVRTRALDMFFRLVMEQGRYFSAGLWKSVLCDLVFTMFADLRDPSVSRRFATVDDLELWFSTTLIKALRHLVALFTEYYPEHLSNALLGDILELLFMCIAQPSEVLGKIGTSCLQDLVRSNYAKWDDDAWSMVCDMFARLFHWSQPRELFSIAGASWESEQKAIADSLSAETNGDSLPVVAPRRRKSSTHKVNRPSPLRTAGSASSLLSADDNSPSPSTLQHAPVPAVPVENGKPDYAHITLKCILQLSLIQTIGELFGINIETGLVDINDDLYGHLSVHHLFVLLDCLDQSRVFASRFNMNRKVRRRLVEMGVMPSMPSLLKQETGSVLVELHVLQRMHSNALGVGDQESSAEHAAVADEVDDRLAVLMQTVLSQYGEAVLDNTDTIVVVPVDVLDAAPAVVKRSAVAAVAWRPAVLAVLHHITGLPSGAFKAAAARLWLLFVQIIGVAVRVRDLEVVGAVQRVLAVAGAGLHITPLKCAVSESG